MRSDFINKRQIDRRRRAVGETGGTYTEYELILLPEFDTIIYHKTANAAGANWNVDRWDVLDGYDNGSTPEKSYREFVVGLLNPWNDGSNIPTGPFGILYAPRTPTRAVLGYDLSPIPATAEILSSELNLTVTSKDNWETQLTLVNQPTEEDNTLDYTSNEVADSFEEEGISTETRIETIRYPMKDPMPAVLTNIPELEEDYSNTSSWLLVYANLGQ
jgi:hypothetical protein